MRVVRHRSNPSKGKSDSSGARTVIVKAKSKRGLLEHREGSQSPRRSSKSPRRSSTMRENRGPPSDSSPHHEQPDPPFTASLGSILSSRGWGSFSLSSALASRTKSLASGTNHNVASREDGGSPPNRASDRSIVSSAISRTFSMDEYEKTQSKLDAMKNKYKVDTSRTAKRKAQTSKEKAEPMALMTIPPPETKLPPKKIKPLPAVMMRKTQSSMLRDKELQRIKNRVQALHSKDRVGNNIEVAGRKTHPHKVPFKTNNFARDPTILQYHTDPAISKSYNSGKQKGKNSDGNRPTASDGNTTMNDKRGAIPKRRRNESSTHKATATPRIIDPVSTTAGRNSDLTKSERHIPDSNTPTSRNKMPATTQSKQINRNNEALNSKKVERGTKPMEIPGPISQPKAINSKLVHRETKPFLKKGGGVPIFISDDQDDVISEVSHSHVISEAPHSRSVKREVSQRSTITAQLESCCWEDFHYHLEVLGQQPNLMLETLHSEGSGGANALHTTAWKCPPPLAVKFFDLLTENEYTMLVAADSDGNTPLHLCCANLSPPDTTDEGKQTVDLSVLKTLLDRVPDSLEKQNNEGDTPLHLFLASSLVSRFTDPWAKEFDDITTEALQMIMKRVPFNDCYLLKDLSGATPLHVAITNESNESILTLLIEAAPAACKTGDKAGMTPLHYVAAFLKTPASVVKRIIQEYSYSICHKTKEGDTPLHLLIRNSTDDVEDDKTTLDENALLIVDLLMGSDTAGRDLNKEYCPLLIENGEKVRRGTIYNRLISYIHTTSTFVSPII